MPSRSDLANAIRALSMDAVQKAKSGHPGAPMGMADIAEVLWNTHLNHNPSNPDWVNRDRFILSNGHGSMLHYSLLHLSGYDLSIDDLKSFRQLHSKTPGHPEYGYAPGIETTTGPLGQGIANGVGMAIAEKVMGAQFNKPNLEIVDHFTYVFLGDGCMMEGISHEVCSLAGTLGLGKLVAFYDDNGISIDGEVEGWFTDDTQKRFEAYGWQVIPRVNGHDSEELLQAIETAKAESDKPTLVICKTIIGFGSPNKEGKEDCHGAPLGDEEIKLTRERLNWPHAPFEIPADIKDAWDANEKGAASESAWNELFAKYKVAHPELAAEFERRSSNELPANFDEKANKIIADVNEQAQTIASRKASQNSIEAFAAELPEFFGGSADLAGSNLTLWSKAQGISANDASGNYCFYGVREFGMSAIMNGIALHKGLVPFGATFLMFMEYARNAVRMAALMKQRSIFVYTHDSIGLGEDGPTHQPVEQIVSLRSTPNLDTWRPCDSVESAVAWKSAITRKATPSALIFSRQALDHQVRTAAQIADIERGGYILKDSVGTPAIILIATGSEVQMAMDSAEQLGDNVRVVSMPCTAIFDQQSAEYKESVLPNAVRKRVAIEACAKDFWFKYTGFDGAIIGMETFGESAPAADLYKHFGITVDAVVAAAKAL
ncbi:transketolase [Marinicellulosiphila megalodicopiae]|uniref:transketolase n=1 Tax=Marinicellulosiphila megalodicopiae TaxID=2724896 RepID=UPI003BB1EA53